MSVYTVRTKNRKRRRRTLNVYAYLDGVKVDHAFYADPRRGVVRTLRGCTEVELRGHVEVRRKR